MKNRSISMLATVAIAATLGVASTANAATLERAGDGAFVYQGGPAGVKLDVQQGYDGSSVVFYGSSLDTVTSFPADCTAQYDSSVVTCPNPVFVRVDLGDGDDHGQVSADVSFPVTLAGGSGRDWLEGNGAANTFDGGPGDDRLTGSAGDDVLRGGDGNDEIAGGAGRDVLDGGTGDDLLHPDGNEDPSADVVDGGPGTDTLDGDYSSRFASIASPVAITLAGGADDGRPGEGDDLRSIERIVLGVGGRVAGTDGADELLLRQVGAPSELTGGGGDDHLRGGDGADRIDGGSGADRIEGGYGDDTIVAGPGRDIVDADASGGDCGPLWCKLPYGNDTIDVRDGEVDSVTCGAGTDRVTADTVDTVAPDCEQVDRASGPSGSVAGTVAAPGKVRLIVAAWPRIATALTRGLTLRLTGVAAAKITLTARLDGKTVATGSARVSRGNATVRLRFTAAARKRLRGRRSLRLAISGAGLRTTIGLRR
jgi:Ca2+-binding RTX toxin-like protein